MKHILITGAYGFVGTSLARAMGSGGDYTLYALDLNLNDSQLYARQYTWDSLEDIPWGELDVVIHLAGIAHDTSNRVNESEYFSVNVGLTQKIFDKFLTSGAGKFIFFSSVKAVVDSWPRGALTESVAPEPVSVYGRSKLKAEEYIVERTPPGGKMVYILRPCMIHGPGNKGNLNMLINWVGKGIPWPLGAFQNRRSFTSVENLVYIMGSFINRSMEPGIYNIADSEALSTSELVHQIGIAFNRKVSVWRINRHLIRFSARVGDLLHLPLNSERLSKLTEDFEVSNDKLLEQLGEPLPVTCRDGLLHTLLSLNKNGSGE